MPERPRTPDTGKPDTQLPKILGGWLEVMRALGNLMLVTVRLFLRDPAKMIHATFEHYLGDRQRAGELIREIEAES